VITGLCVNVEAQLEGVARLKHNASLSEAANANFWSLEVGQNANIAPMVARLFANKSSDLSVIGLCAMAKIQAKYIHTGCEQTPDHILTATCWTDRGDDLGSAQGGRLIQGVRAHEIARSM
jgi:hypothetical protein